MLHNIPYRNTQQLVFILAAMRSELFYLSYYYYKSAFIHKRTNKGLKKRCLMNYCVFSEDKILPSVVHIDSCWIDIGLMDKLTKSVGPRDRGCSEDSQLSATYALMPFSFLLREPDLSQPGLATI